MCRKGTMSRRKKVGTEWVQKRPWGHSKITLDLTGHVEYFAFDVKNIKGPMKTHKICVFLLLLFF